jgi:hypothetical protein
MVSFLNANEMQHKPFVQSEKEDVLCPVAKLRIQHTIFVKTNRLLAKAKEI